MSQENVEVVRAANQAWNAEDMDAVRSGRSLRREPTGRRSAAAL
jgi:hypothetical protein